MQFSRMIVMILIRFLSFWYETIRNWIVFYLKFIFYQIRNSHSCIMIEFSPLIQSSLVWMPVLFWSLEFRSQTHFHHHRCCSWLLNLLKKKIEIPYAKAFSKNISKHHPRWSNWLSWLSITSAALYDSRGELIATKWLNKLFWFLSSICWHWMLAYRES